MSSVEDLFKRLRTDWLLHAMCSMSVCSIAYIFLAAFVPHVTAAFFANFIAIAIGFAKETLDKCHEGHTAEWSDIVADFVGIALADVVIFSSMLLR